MNGWSSAAEYSLSAFIVFSYTATSILKRERIDILIHEKDCRAEPERR